MAHALARRRLSTCNEAYNRLVWHVLSNPLGSIFFSSTADLTDHDKSQGIIIVLKELQCIDEVSTLYRVAADTYSSGLAKACLGQLEGSLIGQGAGAGNNAYMALLVDVARDNAQLCLVYGQDTRAVRADQAGLLASHVSTNLDHILNRHMLGDADYQIQACLNALHDGVSSEARRYEYYGSGSAGSLNSILHSVEYRYALYYLASLARSYTGNNLGTVFQHLLGVEHCSLAGNTLYDNFCIFI